MSDYSMPFGKHAGEQLSAIPTHYLTWLKRECDLREPLATHVAEELSSRPSGKAKARRRTEPALPGDVLEKWYLDLRSTYGTDLDAMRVVTDCAQRLKRLVAKTS